MSVEVTYANNVTEALANGLQREKPKPTVTIVRDPEAEEQGRGSVVGVTGLLAPRRYLARVLHATEHAVQVGLLETQQGAKEVARKVQEIDYPLYGNLVVGVERALADAIKREADRTQRRVSGAGYSLGGAMLKNLSGMPELGDFHVLGSPMINPVPDSVMRHLPGPARDFFAHWGADIPDGKRVTSTLALEDEIVPSLLSRHPKIQRYDVFELGEHLTLPLRKDVSRTIAENVRQTGTGEERNGTFKHTLTGREKPAGIILRRVFPAAKAQELEPAA